MKRIILLISLFIGLFFIIGCSAMKNIQYVPYEVVKTEYTAKIDTTIIRDSVWVERWNSPAANGHEKDTVFITKEKYKYLTKIQRDTIFRVDTIPVIKEVKVPVEYIPKIYKKSFTFSVIIIIGFVILLVLKLYKLWKK